MLVNRPIVRKKADPKKLNQILILFIFILGTIIFGFSLNVNYFTGDKFSLSQSNPTIASTQSIDSKTRQMVQNELQQFTEGFFAQDQNGDPTVAYFIQNPSMSVGFGTSIIKMLIKGSSGTDYTTATVSFPNSNLVAPEAINPILSKATYFIGTSIGQTKQEFTTIVYKNIYKNIDLEYTVKNGQLKYNFYIYPGGNPASIRVEWNGPVSLKQTGTGMQITVATSQKPVVLIDNKPTATQDGKIIDPNFNFQALTTSIYEFNVLHYNNQKLVVIDPTIMVYSTYFGGSSWDYGQSIAVDGNGKIYVTGFTQSNDFPLINAYNNSFGGGSDVFVFKLSSIGSSLIYSTYIGGTGTDKGYGIAVDSSGNAYVTGYTTSSNFPTLNAYQFALAGTTNAFAFKLSSTGNLLYSTYMGGGGADEGYGIAVDSSGNAYVTGTTTSSSFPAIHAYQYTLVGTSSAFLFEISSTGTVLYSTYMGGSCTDYGQSVAVDNSGNAYVTGYTTSSNFPTLNA